MNNSNDIAKTKMSDTNNKVIANKSFFGRIIANSYLNADIKEKEATIESNKPNIPNSSGEYNLVISGDDKTTNT